MSSRSNVIVIGGGIIGVTSALSIQKRGFNVTLIERQDIAAGASFGNAGAFAFSDIIPLATPGIMRKAPKWLLDPLGPLSIPPRYALQIAPWMMRFWRASWQDRFTASIAAQSTLMNLSQKALDLLLEDVKAKHMLRCEGQLQLYESARELEASLPQWDIRERHGIPFQLLRSADEIADIQPGLNRCFTAAGFTPEWCNITDPAAFTVHLGKCFRERGGHIEIAEATSLSLKEGKVSVGCSDGLTRRADHVVVAAGAWSAPLAASLGEDIPLEAERGYNTTFTVSDFDLRTQLTFSGHGFVVTKIGEKIRIGGAVELGGLHLPANYKRAKILVDKAKKFIPGLQMEEGIEWMGFRPSLPDTRPVIGHSNKSHNIIYAFGHGHLGLTQASGTAEIVANLVSGQPSLIDLTPFQVSRF